ncbi:sphingomyelin phosphodiesterase 3 [Plakobranchus ocellatus]|uniref:sphingomyelin phosphodiesterase n=1 Tax=Plakobranchus ocellatus TaxID=259542 RepID=A0AAV4ACK9_9GAST|nr:sphingomyelin phosphodiesterase 3 [Plakobranchus ocellatus]
MGTMCEPIASQVLESCLKVVRSSLYPSYLAFNSLVSLYYPTFEEIKYKETSILIKKILLTPIYTAFFIIFLPILCVFLPLRCLLVSLRKPFAYSEYHNEETSEQERLIREAIRSNNHIFGVGSANICIMPEILSRMNHLSNVDFRSLSIGKRIKEDQLMSGKKDNQVLNLSDSEGSNGSAFYFSNSTKSCKEKVLGDVSVSFPHLDILCVQEAWSSYHNKALIRELHQCFPYIVHDVGVHSRKVNNFVLNSGHLVASRHPIEVVDFKAFTNFVDHGKIISMGVLMIKLQLGPTKNNGQNVAYVFNTHLQSYQGTRNIISKQLDEVLEYSKEFINFNNQADDNIAFCIVCGDFNMDNLSPADQLHSNHKIFDLFEDFARIKPGVEKPWTVGTELRQDRMMDADVSTPQLLKTALDDPVLRQCYLLDADIEEHTHEALVYCHIKMDDQGNVRQVPEGGRRRIDHILFDKQYPLEVKGYHFVTRLAPLTDHIPVAMKFTCPNLQ